MKTKSEIEKRMLVLRDKRANLIDYQRYRIDEKDWHGVRDAATDIEVVTGQIKELEYVLGC
jgi:hypothetical protein